MVRHHCPVDDKWQGINIGFNGLSTGSQCFFFISSVLSFHAFHSYDCSFTYSVRNKTQETASPEDNLKLISELASQILNLPLANVL